MTEDEMHTFVKQANKIHQLTLQTDHYIPLDEQPTLTIKLGDRQFVAIEYWWEDDDFVFVTDNDEKYRCVNAYPVSMRMDGLDYSSTDEIVMVENKIRYNKEQIEDTEGL